MKFEPASKNRTGFEIVGQELQTLLDGGAYGSYGVASHLLHRRAADGHLPASRAIASAAAAPSPTSRRAVPSAATARRSRASARGAARQDRATTLGVDPAELAPRQRRAARLADRQLAARRHRSGLGRVHRRGGRRRRAGTSGAASSADGRGVGLACSSYLCGAGLPIYWNEMPHSGVQLKLDRSRRRHRVLRRHRDRPGLGRCAGRRASPRCSASIRSTSAPSPATPISTPVDLGSYSSRVTLMMGNAAIQAAERARALLAGAVADKLERADGAAGLRRAAASSTARIRTPASRSPRRCGSPRRSSARSAPPAAIAPPKSPRRLQGRAASARRRRTRTPPPSSRSRSIARPAGCACRKSGSRTTSAARSTRRWRAARSRAASTWALGEALMEEQAFRRLPPKLSRALRAQVSVDARVQEPDHARHARRRDHPRSRSPIRTGRSAPRKWGRARCCR